MINLLHIPVDGLNRRPLTETDFHAVCEREGVQVLTRDVHTSFYLTALGRSFIVIPRRRRGMRRLFQMWHELGHHFLHGGRDGATQAFFYGMLESRNEAEADAFAVIALVPSAALRNYDWLEENPSRYAAQLWRRRKRIHSVYGV